MAMTDTAEEAPGDDDPGFRNIDCRIVCSPEVWRLAVVISPQATVRRASELGHANVLVGVPLMPGTPTSRCAAGHRLVAAAGSGPRPRPGGGGHRR